MYHKQFIFSNLKLQVGEWNYSKEKLKNIRRTIYVFGRIK